MFDDISNLGSSMVFLNDTKKLAKKRNMGKYSRQLFSKLKNSSMPKKSRFKTNFYQRYSKKPKRNTFYGLNIARKPKVNARSEWTKEYDVWNMIVQAIDHSLINDHKVKWTNKEFGVRDLDTNIRLLKNRQELNRQILVCSNGRKTYLKDLLSSDDSTDKISVKIKFKLVPVVESITLVNKSIETLYNFAEDQHNEINNNDVECKTIETGNLTESLEDDQTLIYIDENVTSVENTLCEKTITNSTCSTWEYSEFCYDMMPDASSTFIADSEENRPLLEHEEESITLSINQKK